MQSFFPGAAMPSGPTTFCERPGALKNDGFCAESSRKSRTMRLICLRACLSRADGRQATHGRYRVGAKEVPFQRSPTTNSQGGTVLIRHFKRLCLIITMAFAVVCYFNLPTALSAQGRKENAKSIRHAPKPNAVPRIQFEELFYDFGKSFQHQTLEHIFLFRNTGNANLHIIKVKAG